jgi:NAD+ synthase
VDSATALFVAIKALKPENVYALHLPAKNSNPIHMEHAKLVVTAAQIPATNFQMPPIGAIIQKAWRVSTKYGKYPSMEGMKNGNDASQLNRLRLANLSARIRMMLLFDQAKKLDALVIGTENLSEHLLGYYTRFGDEASDIEPIRHLYKSQVIELAKYLKIPDPIIQKPPSADLWCGQTDAQELGFTYAEADPILYLQTLGKSTPEIVSQGFDATLVEQVLNQVNSTKFKTEVPYKIES